MTRSVAESPLTWPKDTALLRSNRSADPGAKTDKTGRARPTSRVRPSLPSHPDWHQSDKPSRHDAAISPTGGRPHFTNSNQPKFHFTLNQDNGSTALSDSIYHGYDSLSLLLIKSGANPNTKTGIYIDGTGDITPLHRATKSAKVLKALLRHGAKTSVRDDTGSTPLHWAVREFYIESVRLLIKAGADVNAKDKEGARPVNYVGSPDLIEPPRDAVAKQIAKLLRDAGAK